MALPIFNSRGAAIAFSLSATVVAAGCAVSHDRMADTLLPSMKDTRSLSSVMDARHQRPSPPTSPRARIHDAPEAPVIRVAARPPRAPDTAIPDRTKPIPTVSIEPHEPKDAAAPTAAGGPALSAAEARARASEAMSRGEVLSAREVLTAPAIADDPAVIEALAETFDPVVLNLRALAATYADSQIAKRYYRLAIEKGNVDAAGHLAALEASEKR